MAKAGLMFIAVALLACFMVSGCENGQGNETAISKDNSADAVAPIVLCGLCGELKGSARCCVPGAKKCDKCGLNDGSPGCCKIPKGKDVILCPKCGEIKDSPKCCRAGAIKCAKCGMNLGSPHCCQKKRMYMAR